MNDDNSSARIDWVKAAESQPLTVLNFVEGRWKPPALGEPFAKYSPRDGRLLCKFGGAEATDADDAVAAARRSFVDGRWSKLSAGRRSEALYRFASLIEQRCDELALLECLDVGKPISDAVNFDIPAAAAIIRYCAGAADKVHGKVYGVDSSSLSYQLHRPIGVVAGIVGWNFPLVLAAEKLGPALATGNCLVLKPSELTSFSAARAAELAIEAGIPEGVLNVIHGGGAVGAALARHPDVDLLTFTGSSRTGKKLLIDAGHSNMKRLILECGGKAPNIVFDDSPNLDAVADAIVARAFWNQGQVCTASSRVLVQDSIKEELLRLVIKRVSALSLGDPLLPETKFGALVSQQHKEKVLGYIDRGEKEGARLAYRSQSSLPWAKGFYVAPAIFDGVSPAQRIAQEEIFGPVLSVISFRDEEDAIRIANATIYGLSAILWTRDMGRAHRVTQGVNVGWLVVNATGNPMGGTGRGALPIGGHKESGVGVEGGLEGLEAYTRKTTVQSFV